jgi:hypothetical protein
MYIVWRCHDCPSALMVVGYWLVHITLGVAAISGHYLPSVFEVIPFPLLHFLTDLLPYVPAWPPYANPAWTLLTYATLWVLLIIFHWMAGIPLWFPRRDAEGNQ